MMRKKTVVSRAGLVADKRIDNIQLVDSITSTNALNSSKLTVCHHNVTTGKACHHSVTMGKVSMSRVSENPQGPFRVRLELSRNRFLKNPMP